MKNKLTFLTLALMLASHTFTENVPAFIVERHADGQFTVFVSSSPTPIAGAIYILQPERVHPVDVPLRKAMVCVTEWGGGSG